MRTRLAEAAGDSTLAPWQREFMLDVARQRTKGTGARPSPTLPNALLGSDGIATDDGSWVGVAALNMRTQHTAIYDPVRDRMLVFGGDDGTRLRNDAWALVWGTPVSVPGGPTALGGRFELTPPRPNPSRGETVVDFELREPGRVALDVFDGRGRRVKRIVDDWFSAGRHVSTWLGDDDRGHVVGSGVYFIRLQEGGFQASRLMVRIR